MNEDLTRVMCDALDVSCDDIEVVGNGALSSAFRVTDLAVASLAAAGSALRALLSIGDDRPIQVTVDRDLASSWLDRSIRPVGWQLPPLWDAIAGDYRTADGWIRLHTNASHHRAAALSVLGVQQAPEVVAAAVGRFTGDELETAIVAAGGAAAAMRTVAQWHEHPQGRAVSAESLVAVRTTGAAPSLHLSSRQERPLDGLRVLDLTRVLAGPVATRLLAGWGATVLRLDPPDWDEPAVIPEMMLGKRTARLDLRQPTDRERFVELLTGADVLVHGYRSDALERLGFGAEVRERVRPGLVDVSLDAYGWTGPWATRRGFDSLVQMSCGIAADGMRVLARDRPTPLPVQALDHVTGYLLAAATLRGLTKRATTQHGTSMRLSLARTAKLLMDGGANDPDKPAPRADQRVIDVIEHTSWGPARRLRAPLAVTGAPLRWDLPARALGSDAASW